MIISDCELIGRFKDLLNVHTRVDIATAWATGGVHLRVLAEATKREHSPVKVRAIVGTAGNATRPDALKELYKITNGNLRIVRGGQRLFHPKLYLFRRQTNGRVGSHAWVGSANFTKAGFGKRGVAKNEEIIVQIGPGETTDALAEWFRKRCKPCPKDPPVKDVIQQYADDWKGNPPGKDLRKIVSGEVSRRIDLLDDAHRPLTLEGYRHALDECERMLRDEEADWKVLNSNSRSYMGVIYERQQLLLGKTRWSQLDRESQIQLKGGVPRSASNWWGLLGRMARSNGQAVWSNENKIRRILNKVVSADDTEFPGVAVAAFQELKGINNVAHGTATLLLTLARPDRLLSLNSASEKAYCKLSGKRPSRIRQPEGYGKLLDWLYAQPWYGESPPTDKILGQIWRFRAALVDAFVYEWT